MECGLKESTAQKQETRDKGVFDVFYVPFLRYVEKNISSLMEKGISGMKIRTGIKDQIISYTRVSLVELCIKTLITDMNRMQQEGVLKGAAPRERYLEYTKLLEEGRTQKLLNDYFMLGTLISIKINGILKLAEEIFVHLEQDLDIIRERFQLKAKQWQGLELGKGDTHNHGKTVAVLQFDGTEKIVYKSRSMQAEKGFGNICAWLREQNSSLDLKTAEVLERNTYGWQEYVMHKDCKSQSQIHKYYYRTGAAMALFHIYNTSDLHGENIIPCGEYPVFIDLETLFTNVRNNQEQGSMQESLQEAFRHSVLSSGLLPQAFQNKVLDIDISGLGAKEGQRSERLTYQELTGHGTSDMRLEERPYITENLGNGVTLHNKEVSYTGYIEDMAWGFRNVYEIILEKKQEFLDLTNTCFSGGSYRQVLRGTFVYVRYLNASHHPKYLSGKGARTSLFQLINKDNSKKSEMEIEQMMEHDVPYFLSSYENADLYSAEGLVEKNYFKGSILELIEENINRMSHSKERGQEMLIRNSVLAAQKDVMEHEGEFQEKLNRRGTSCMEAAAAITERMMEYAVWNQKKDACTFIDMNLEAKGAGIGTIPGNLYGGAGAVWYLFVFASITGEKKHMEFAEASLRGLEELQPIKRAVLDTGAFSGYFSYIYLYYNLYCLTGKTKYHRKYDRALEQVKAYNPKKEPLYDIIAGISGALIVLSNIYERENSTQLKKMIEGYGKILQEKAEAGIGRSLTGFSHGYSGFALALWKAGQALEKTEFLDAARRLEQEEDQWYCEKQHNWKDLRSKEERGAMYWCHGAPGILLARCSTGGAKQVVSKWQVEIDEIAASVRSGKGNDSLCHGRMGNLDILLTIARKSQDTRLLEETGKLYKALAEQISYEGISFGIPGMGGMISFMLGMSGIGYGFLRWADYRVPSVLSLEIYGGEECGTDKS